MKYHQANLSILKLGLSFCGKNNDHKERGDKNLSCMSYFYFLLTTLSDIIIFPHKRHVKDIHVDNSKNLRNLYFTINFEDLNTNFIYNKMCIKTFIKAI
jgi:hypothetical protein